MAIYINKKRNKDLKKTDQIKPYSRTDFRAGLYPGEKSLTAGLENSRKLEKLFCGKWRKSEIKNGK